MKTSRSGHTSGYLQSLSAHEQRAVVEEFLQWAVVEAHNNPDPRARAEAEIGIATTREFLDKTQPRINTGDERDTTDE